jgi:hypothetical protein
MKRVLWLFAVLLVLPLGSGCQHRLQTVTAPHVRELLADLQQRIVTDTKAGRIPLADARVIDEWVTTALAILEDPHADWREALGDGWPTVRAVMAHSPRLQPEIARVNKLLGVSGGS